MQKCMVARYFFNQFNVWESSRMLKKIFKYFEFQLFHVIVILTFNFFFWNRASVLWQYFSKVKAWSLTIPSSKAYFIFHFVAVGLLFVDSNSECSYFYIYVIQHILNVKFNCTIYDGCYICFHWFLTEHIGIPLSKSSQLVEVSNTWSVIPFFLDHWLLFRTMSDRSLIELQCLIWWVDYFCVRHRHLFHSKNICPLLFLTSR
jgi:hypothetical protein